MLWPRDFPKCFAIIDCLMNKTTDCREGSRLDQSRRQHPRGQDIVLGVKQHDWTCLALGSKEE